MHANDGADLDAQLASKEREWKELQTLRFQQQETSLRDAQEQLYLLKQRFQQLKEDFRFNLNVLEERDRELERYDAMSARALVTETARQEEVSQLRIQVAKLQEVKEREAGEREEEIRRSQQRAAEHRLQLERLQSAYAGDIEKQREEYEQMKRNLQRRVQEVEGELALQKQEMMTDFDNELRRREHEFNLRMDEMRAVVLSHELRVKLVSKETEVQVRAHAQAVEDLNASEELRQHTLSQLQHRDWEIKDIAAVKDSRIKELEDQLKALQTKRKREEEVYKKKHEDLDRAVREREARLDALQEAHMEQSRQAEGHATQLQSQLDAMTTHTRRTQREHEDTLRERDEQMDRLRTELETTRCGWDTYISQVSKETVVKDTELMALQERESKLRTELDRSRGETERYKQQLSESLEREKALEQRRVQVEIEWQRRCEDSKAEHYLNSEALIQGLTQARDQATAELREKQRELQDMSILLHTVTMERNKALGRPVKEQIQRCGGDGGNLGELPSDEISRLQQQNNGLRSVIAQMRKDMEELSQAYHPPVPSDTSTQLPKGQLPQPPAQSSAQLTDSGPVPSLAMAGTPDYAQALEEEVAVLKARCRCLEDQLEDATRLLNTTTVTPAPTLAPVAPDNAYLQNHIRYLNETIGGLRVEKVANTAALRKQEVRVAHLEAALASLTQQCHTKQMEGEELRLELANQKRKWSSEETSLRQRLVAMEMELEEVRQEKEEYQKGSILNNLESVALGNQVSALKLNIASRTEPIICEESKMVRHLREENLCLRQHQLTAGLRPGGWGGYGPEGGVNGGNLGAPLSGHILQSKLRQAVRCIGRLTRDKQQLIEMGNRLRAQLADAGLEVVQSATTPSLAPESMEPERDSTRNTQAQPGKQNQPGRLSALEQLQYQLTKQELQYAQRDQTKGAPVLVRTVLSDRDGVTNPWSRVHKDTNSHEVPGIKENSPVPLSPSQSSLQLDLGPGTPSSPSGPPLQSSVETEGSLRDVWQMLDHGLSPSILTSRESCSETGDAELARRELSEPSTEGQGRGIPGFRAPFPERNKPTRLPPTNMARKTKVTARGARIRNYNVKD
ncbi:coiled-coil domain-containing protein 57 [Esox lucius]|uniref:Coiled-coil domain containing 57 n=1 Tax=Esox lucius TaxID=8010 RepID=A0AAY5K6F4_ESOLU|nr:coiled-coil domain-containing protein 57 [Esox lucius]XP_019902108.2 coiled-coil domain-containing protein 57 [Esox lucius]